MLAMYVCLHCHVCMLHVFGSHCLLPAKVVKHDCDTVGRGWHPPPGFQDLMAINRWAKALKPVVPGREEAATQQQNARGRQPKLGHHPRAEVPRRCVIQLDTEDVHMLVVPPAFQQGFRDWIRIPLPRVVPVSDCRWCDEWVQVDWFKGQVVFKKNWSELVNKYDLVHDYVVELKLQAFGVKLTIYKADNSSARQYTCPDHG